MCYSPTIRCSQPLPAVRSAVADLRRSATQMKLPLTLGVFLIAALSFAATNEYTITILKPDPLAAISRPEYQASTNLVGRSIAAIFGPVSEVRVELGGDADTKKVESTIRGRIDRVKCLGRGSEIPWHKAIWVRGHLLLKDGRILPMQILMSGIIVGDLLFTEEAKPAVISEQSPSEERIRKLATQHRDQWLAKHTTEDSAELARGVIQSVEKIEGGWHVVFATRTGGGPGAEEGLHVYFLHVYLTPAGELDRVVRGPDLLS